MRIRIASALLVPAIVLVAGPLLTGCMSKARRHLYNAEDLFEKRDLKGAKAELGKSIAADPDLLEAHKSLAHIDEYLGDGEGAGREYDIASRLDPTDTKLMNKARYYRYLQELSNSADQAIDDVKAGKIEDGLKTIKNILTQTKDKSAHEKAVAALQKAMPLIIEQADELEKQGKHEAAIDDYAQGLRGYMLISEARHLQKIDPGADAVMHSISGAAKAASTPERSFQILNDILTVYPENKTANLELAQLYLNRKPPDYITAADLMERGGAPDDEVKQLRQKAKHHRG